MTKNTIYEPMDTNPDHYKVDNADFSAYMKDPKIHGFGQWMFANGYNLALPYIVRCKDCKHATMTTDGKLCKYCEMDTDDFGDQREVYHDADWFCADGKRAENAR